MHLAQFSQNAAYIITEYTELGSNEELPLGEEFQNLVKCFIDPKEKKANKRYALTNKLLEQLA
ncbi:hypothetical protein DPMN_170736 [Dreissena polymorpha]|uniref:Uncharacterized protein n=1 Tax=Dreissena polymorpha TaxID=45954 RepID=A0A9D4DWQ2_DREPO|nr:hypothetical protein DPMN_170736 [Dreissena polymorpha]